MPISEEVRNAIIEDLKEDRLTFEEIAAKRLGDPKKKNIIGKIAEKANLSRKDRRGKHRKSHSPKVADTKPTSPKPIQIETFGSGTRLSLIDEAITIHKSLLANCTDPYKMDKWSAALERLFDQRRMEESGGNEKENEMLTAITDYLYVHSSQSSP